MGKRNPAAPDKSKTPSAGVEGAAQPRRPSAKSAGSGEKPGAGKPAARKPVAQKTAPAKPAAETASAPPPKTPARKKTAAAKSAPATRAAADRPGKKAPARRRATPQAQPAAAAPIADAAIQPGYLPPAPLETPRTENPPVLNFQPPASGLQSPAALAHPPAYVAAGVSRLILMIRDPEWLYSYWDISEADRAAHAIGQPQGAPPLLLRVRDQGEGPEPVSTGEYLDVNIIPDASGWYVRIPRCGGHWSAALGYLNYEGAFVSLAQSNLVTTPRPLPGEWNEQTWGPVGEEMGMVEAAGLAAPPATEYGGAGQTRLVRRASRLMAYLRGLGASEQIPRPGASEQAIPRFGASELGIPRPGTSEQAPFFGASEQSARQTGGVAVLEKTFWLQVQAELIVHGATEPDAQVTVQGMAIQLRPDGTFTLRFALPDGEQVIPVHGISAAGDMERTITPIVKKRTV